MNFLLATLKAAYMLNTPKSEIKENVTLADLRTRQKWENDDYICRGHILNYMSDSLFDVYQNTKIAKKLWKKL